MRISKQKVDCILLSCRGKPLCHGLLVGPGSTIQTSLILLGGVENEETKKEVDAIRPINANVKKAEVLAII